MTDLFTALTTAFSTGIIVFLYIGNVTKLTSLAFYPLVFLLLLRLKEKIRLIDFLLLIITLQFFILGFHVQIIYYTVLSIGIYFLYYFIRALVKKDNVLRNGIIKSAVVFAGALFIALLIQSDSLHRYMNIRNILPAVLKALSIRRRGNSRRTLRSIMITIPTGRFRREKS